MQWLLCAAFLRECTAERSDANIRAIVALALHSRDVLKRDGVLRRQSMIARHDDDKRLLDDDRIVQVGHLRFGTHEGQVELPPQQSLRKIGRILAGD